MTKTGSSGNPQRVVYLAITMCAFVLSCGKSVQVERQAKHGAEGQIGDGNAAAFSLSPGIPSICREVSDQAITTDGISGIIAIVKQGLIDAGQSQRKVCIQCQPRELMRTKCFDVDVGPLEAVCRHNEPEARARGVDINVICKNSQVKSDAKEVSFNLKPNRVEQAISNLPLLALLVETQVVPKLAAGSKRLLVASSAIDFAKLYAKPVLLGQGFDEAADVLVAKAVALRALTGNSSASPALTEAQKNSVRQTALKLFADLSTLAAKSDSISAKDLSTLSAAIFSEVPELAPYGFVLPFLFSDGGETMLPQNFIAALPASVIASFIQGAGSTGDAR